MRTDGLVHGMLLDRHECHPLSQRQNFALSDLRVDVSDLRYGRPVCANQQIIKRCSHHYPGHSLYHADFYGRIFQRLHFKEA